MKRFALSLVAASLLVACIDFNKAIETCQSGGRCLPDAGAGQGGGAGGGLGGGVGGGAGGGGGGGGGVGGGAGGGGGTADAGWHLVQSWGLPAYQYDPSGISVNAVTFRTRDDVWLGLGDSLYRRLNNGPKFVEVTEPGDPYANYLDIFFTPGSDKPWVANIGGSGGIHHATASGSWDSYFYGQYLYCAAITGSGDGGLIQAACSGNSVQQVIGGDAGAPFWIEPNPDTSGNWPLDMGVLGPSHFLLVGHNNAQFEIFPDGGADGGLGIPGYHVNTVFTVAPDDVYVGSSVGLFHRAPDSGVFVQDLNGPTDSVNRLRGSGPNDLWAVTGNVLEFGNPGDVWHFDGTAWQQLTPDPNASYFGVAEIDGNLVYVTAELPDSGAGVYEFSR